MKRERGPNTRQLLYSQSVLYAAVEVLREKAGIQADEFEKMTDAKFDEMFPQQKKTEVMPSKTATDGVTVNGD